MSLFYHFNLKKNGVLKSKIPCILLNKNINLNKNEIDLKIENLTCSFKGQEPCASAHISIVS